MKTTTLKFDSECWDKIPVEFLEEIASRYGDLPRSHQKNCAELK